ncbi:MAG: PaaI family thioesterase, partial [Eggerthellaceae bacterium]|nr:PaaI family thioesterase [Eggerthellaceae bacterium]
MDLHKLFNKTVEFKDCNLSVYEPGHVVLTTPVNVTNLNPYENAHGGYLFTLCDSTAGAVAYSLGSY